MVINNIAIIPARKGSKRIKNKNIIDFNGLPMIAWTIKAALNTKLFDHVLVSTDSEQIAEIKRILKLSRLIVLMAIVIQLMKLSSLIFHYRSKIFFIKVSVLDITH